MCASAWPITLLLLFGLATSSPVSTPAPPLPVQILPPSPSPTILPSPPSPPLSVLAHFSGESEKEASCRLMISPSTLVVRFGDPFTANCSAQSINYGGLGWEISLETSGLSQDNFVILTVDNMTKWSITATCYALTNEGGSCDIKLPLIVYKPPDNVSISLINHTGPMYEGRQYTLQCTVQGVAPVGNLIVTFYRGQTILGQLQSNNTTEKEPVTEIFTLNITPSKEDNGIQYWCEAKLELGPEGPQPPPVLMSQKLITVVLFGPHLVCPTKLLVREGQSLSCEVRGNPQPEVLWFRDGQAVALPTHSSRKDAGKYTAVTKGHLGLKNFTVDVEVLAGSGTANSCNRHLLAFLLIYLISWL
ncbi:intercellular adhesion molecule 4-like [Dicentrarchus labrax]|uniref:Ig-like domain-containing protein n=1 Tax=Dicentrarchus labrax TaxID=13489 RepID=A0A8P4G9E5_DICLA|nr:intercellular adhesion molecule 4-like [Dicentrarchus labrax]